jgi:hypothetical protein
MRALWLAAELLVRSYALWALALSAIHVRSSSAHRGLYAKV